MINGTQHKRDLARPTEGRADGAQRRLRPATWLRSTAPWQRDNAVPGGVAAHTGCRTPGLRTAVRGNDYMLNQTEGGFGYV